MWKAWQNDTNQIKSSINHQKGTQYKAKAEWATAALARQRAVLSKDQAASTVYGHLYFELISAVDKVSMCMFLRACTHFAMTDELRVMESVW